VRVIYCTRGGLFGALVLNQLYACEKIEVCGIVRSSRMFHPRLDVLRGAVAYIRCSGISYALYLLCATTLADLLGGFGAVGHLPARHRSGSAPVHTTRDINDPVSLQFVRECAPDLLVSAFFDQRLREPVLATPALGCINIHPSLLPDFRGVDPVLQARLHRADLGVTVHYMTPVLDQGAILAQRSLAHDPRASVFATTASLFSAGAELLVSQLERVEHGDHGSPQRAGGSYQSWPTRAEVRALRAGGGALMRLADFKLLRGRNSA
jgi:methionyl-tRNA formyltransferase